MDQQKSPLFLRRRILEATSLFLLVSYSLGFYAWNFYLSRYSFFEYDLLQTRYISAGVLCLVIIFIIFLVFYLIELLIGKILSIKFLNIKINIDFFNPSRLIISFLLVLFLYIPIFFPYTPPYFGGAEPTVTAIMATPDKIEYLSNFNIKPMENANKKTVETYPVCNFYQNKDFIIIGVVDTDNYQPRRVLILKQNQILGFNQRLRQRDFEEIYCRNFGEWSFKSFYRSK